MFPKINVLCSVRKKSNDVGGQRGTLAEVSSGGCMGARGCLSTRDHDASWSTAANKTLLQLLLLLACCLLPAACCLLLAACCLLLSLLLLVCLLPVLCLLAVYVVLFYLIQIVLRLMMICWRSAKLRSSAPPRCSLSAIGYNWMCGFALLLDVASARDKL